MEYPFSGFDMLARLMHETNKFKSFYLGLLRKNKMDY